MGNLCARCKIPGFILSYYVHSMNKNKFKILSIDGGGIRGLYSAIILKKIEDKFSIKLNEHFDLKPAVIIRNFDLRRPIYKNTAAYGHFGRNDLNLPWEALDKVDVLKKYL